MNSKVTHQIVKINSGAYSLNLLQTEYNFGGSKEHMD